MTTEVRTMFERAALPILAFTLLFAAPVVRAQEAAAPAAESDAWDARVSEFKGEVQVHAPGETDAVPVEKGMVLEEGDRITTGEDASVDISLDGGTLIHLSANTDFTISDTNRKQTSFKLTLGTFLAKVQKLLAGQSMVVQAPTAVAAVRGTEFGVEVDPASPDESHFGVFDEGKVEVRGAAGGSETIIGGQETKVAKGQPPAHAYQLQRFMKHRAFMRAAMKRRLGELKHRWKALPAAQRRALRQKAMQRMRQRRQELRQKAQENKQKRDQENKRDKRGVEEGRKKREKMEKFRESIRKRKGGGGDQ